MGLLYFIGRLLVCPFVLAWFVIMGVMTLLAAFGLWVLTGEGRTASVTVGSMRPRPARIRYPSRYRTRY